MAEAAHRSITCRALLAGSVAAVPTAALAGPPGVAAAPGAEADPVFAAIAVHARAYAAYEAQRRDDEENDEALVPLIDIEHDAAEAFAATVPSTLAGAAAALAYVRMLHERDNYPLLDDYDCYVLIASIEAAVRNALEMNNTRS